MVTTTTKKPYLPKVRTIFNLGDFNDYTHTGSDSLTDPSDNASTEALIAKLLRGESVGARYIPEYDVEPTMSEDEAFATMDVTKSGDFDLADAVSLKHKAMENKRRLDVLKKEQQRIDSELKGSKSATADEGAGGSGSKGSGGTQKGSE